MKKIAGFALTAMIMVLALSGCTKSGGGSDTANEGLMTVTVGGTTISSKNCHACSCGSPDSYEIIVSGTTLNLVIYVKEASFVVGSCTIDSVMTHSSASYTPTSGSQKIAKTGTVTITTLTAGVKVVGTFNFTCTDGTTVNNGSFTAIFD